MERILTLAQHIAIAVEARHNCTKSGNAEWHAKHTQSLQTLSEFLPSGSGLDSGTKIDAEASSADKIVLTTSFHHMNTHGSYDGWTDHVVIIKPAFHGFTISVSGRNRSDIKDYLADTFDMALRTMIVQTADGFHIKQEA